MEMYHTWLAGQDKTISGEMAVDSVIPTLAILELSLLLAYKCLQKFNQRELISCLPRYKTVCLC